MLVRVESFSTEKSVRSALSEVMIIACCSLGGRSVGGAASRILD